MNITTIPGKNSSNQKITPFEKGVIK